MLENGGIPGAVPPGGAVADDNAQPGRSLRLAERLTARLCHDISGALGTVVNALELAATDAESLPEALPLAEEASAGLRRHLRLLRAAWGGGAEPMDMATLLELAEGLPTARKLRIDGSAVQAGVPFGAPAARLMLNLVMLAAESLPRGGRLALAGDPQREIVALIEGQNAAWPAGFGACVADTETAWRSVGDARTLVGPLLALLARDQGAQLSFLFGAGTQEPPPLLIRLA